MSCGNHNCKDSETDAYRDGSSFVPPKADNLRPCFDCGKHPDNNGGELCADDKCAASIRLHKPVSGWIAANPPIARKFRKKPVVIEAIQWHALGDHPTVVLLIQNIIQNKVGLLLENTAECAYCGKKMSLHGYIATLEGGHIVCPGDWIITGTAGEQYPCKPDIFPDIYEEVFD